MMIPRLSPNNLTKPASPLVAARTVVHRDATRGHIHPPHNLAPNEIDIHTIIKIPRMIARGSTYDGRAQVVPVCVPAGITRRVVGLAPEEQERVHAYPHPGKATPDGFLVQGFKRLEALHQPTRLEIGGAGRGGGLCDVRVDLACGHDVPIEHKLGLLCRGQPLYRCVIRAPGEHDHHTEQHPYPAYEPLSPLHSISFLLLALGLWSTPLSLGADALAPDDLKGLDRRRQPVSADLGQLVFSRPEQLLGFQDRVITRQPTPIASMSDLDRVDRGCDGSGLLGLGAFLLRGQLGRERPDMVEGRELGADPAAKTAHRALLEADDFATTGGVADMDRVGQVELRDGRREVVGIRAPVIAVPWLARAPVPTAVMGNALTCWRS